VDTVVPKSSGPWRWPDRKVRENRPLPVWEPCRRLRLKAMAVPGSTNSRPVGRPNAAQLKNQLTHRFFRTGTVPYINIPVPLSFVPILFQSISSIAFLPYECSNCSIVFAPSCPAPAKSTARSSSMGVHATQTLGRSLDDRVERGHRACPFSKA